MCVLLLVPLHHLREAAKPRSSQDLKGESCERARGPFEGLALAVTLAVVAATVVVVQLLLLLVQIAPAAETPLRGRAHDRVC